MITINIKWFIFLTIYALIIGAAFTALLSAIVSDKFFKRELNLLRTCWFWSFVIIFSVVISLGRVL